jgi:hypothetical protein
METHTTRTVPSKYKEDTVAPSIVPIMAILLNCPGKIPFETLRIPDIPVNSAIGPRIDDAIARMNIIGPTELYSAERCPGGVGNVYCRTIPKPRKTMAIMPAIKLM